MYTSNNKFKWLLIKHHKHAYSMTGFILFVFSQFRNSVWFQKYTERYIYILNKHQIIKIPIYGYVSYVVVTIPPFFPLSLIFRRIFENSNTMDASSTAGTTTILEHLIRLHLFLLGFPFVQLHIFKYLVSPCDVRDDFCIKRCSSYSQLFYLCLFMYSDV